ncbi:MAG: YceI family protein, partial [Fulvivirga sp.]|nr:YceI family protein [Fulvivirga sp.]
MNRTAVLITFLFLWSCDANTKQKNAVSEKQLVSEDNHPSFDYDTILINTDKSIVKWKGTKLMKTGKHMGTVRFKRGELYFAADTLVGGKLIVNMQSIYNTDIPKDDPVPRRKLTAHLNSDFKTDSFPRASYEIIHAEKQGNDSYRLKGYMTIRGVRQPMKVTAMEYISKKHYGANVVFDRTDWKIGEEGSWLEQKLVDDEIT